MPKLSKAGREEVALALLLLKDFKTDGKFDTDLTIQIFKLADVLGVKNEFEEMMSKLPPMKIVPRE